MTAPPPAATPSDTRHAAFTELYLDYHQPLLRIVRRRAPSVDHEAAVSDAFKALWLAWDDLTGERRAWLTRVALNTAFTQLRRRRREKELLTAGGGIPVGHLDTPDDRINQLIFFHALPRLPRALGTTMLLRYLEGRPLAQLATDRGTTTLTVTQEISRARHGLRTLLYDT